MMPEAGGAKRTGDGSLFSDVGMMVVEGRLAGGAAPRGFKEGPHCPPLTNSPSHHACIDTAFLCERADKLRQHMRLLSENGAPLCVEVLLCPGCPCGSARAASTNICQVPTSEDLLLEQWTISVVKDGMPKAGVVDDRVLLQAVRSQLHFSQLASWCSLGGVRNVTYRVCHPPVGVAGFTRPPVAHDFPPVKISATSCLKVSLKSLPRLESMPTLACPIHHAPIHESSSSSALTATVTVFKSVFAELGQCLLDPPARIPAVRNGFTMWRESKSTTKPSPSCNSQSSGLVDDRMQSGCQHIGKHRCEDDDSGSGQHNRGCPRAERSTSSIFSALSGNRCSQFLSKTPSDDSDEEPLEAEVLLSSLLRRGARTGSPGRRARPPTLASGGGTPKIRSPPTGVANPLKRKWAAERGSGSKKLLSDSDPTGLARLFNRLDITPSSLRVSIDLPVSSSTYKKDENDAVEKLPPHPLTPTPIPRLNIPRPTCWTVGPDSSSEETEGESPVSSTIKNAPPWSSPCPQRSSPPSPFKHRRRPLSKCSKPLLGNFEENILGGRLKPTSVVDGFTADLGASGSFCPQHLKLPVTMSFFSIEPHSAPCLGEMRLGKKGYTVPSAGTIQLTLLNPLGTVVKMFVVGYDVSDMPPNCHTFVRQRSVSPPSSNNFLIHLRLRSSKSGRISLWGDVKTLLCRRQYDCVASAVATDEPDQTVILVPSFPRYTPYK
uniref:Protein FAM214B n=1 Tax=Lygus hesperus TaxID=30085 RepID=A0A0K8TFR2_LYGHE